MKRKQEFLKRTRSQRVDDGIDAGQLNINYQSRDGVVVCEATPCQVYARPGTLVVQASGSGVLSYTTDFEVPVNGARVTLRAPSVSSRRSAGMLLAAGLGALIAGGVTAGVGAAFDHAGGTLPNGMTEKNSTSTVYYGVGGALLSAGAVMAIAGGALWAHNSAGVDGIAPLPPGVHF